MSDSSRCRSCGQEIVWCKSVDNQKNVPVNPTPDPNANVLLSISHKVCKIVSAEEKMSLTDDQKARLRMPHWATCPDAKDWRKKK